MAISVDGTRDAAKMVKRDGLPFTVLSDPPRKVVDLFGLRDTDEKDEMSRASVYIADPSGEIYYRKIGWKRPSSQELIDAIDYYRGRWPQPRLD